MPQEEAESGLVTLIRDRSRPDRLTTSAASIDSQVVRYGDIPVRRNRYKRVYFRPPASGSSKQSLLIVATGWSLLQQAAATSLRLHKRRLLPASSRIPWHHVFILHQSAVVRCALIYFLADVQPAFQAAPVFQPSGMITPEMAPCQCYSRKKKDNVLRMMNGVTSLPRQCRAGVTITYEDDHSRRSR